MDFETDRLIYYFLVNKNGLVKDVEGQIPGSMECVTLYEYGWFNGKSQTFGTGKHDMNEMKLLDNDSACSLKVLKGYQAMVFEHKGFQGKMAVFGPGEHNIDALKKSGFANNAVSSLIIAMDDGILL